MHFFNIMPIILFINVLILAFRPELKLLTLSDGATLLFLYLWFVPEVPEVGEQGVLGLRLRRGDDRLELWRVIVVPGQ